jgi:hypothetical protein
MGRPKSIIDRDVLEKLYVGEKMSPKQIAIQVGCNRQTIINHLRLHRIRVRTKGEGTALAKIVHRRTDFSGDQIEKAYLIGFRTGDLTVDLVNPNGQTIRASCASTRPEQITLIKNLFEKYGGIILNGPYKNNRVFIQCMLNMTFDFLLPKSDNIPGWIMEKDETFWAFLGGYADAEAHIGISGNKASFRLATADSNILKTIYDRLAQFGIKCPKPYLWLQSGYTNKNNVTNRKDIWRLGVYSTESVTLLLDTLLPFLQHQKRQRDAEIVMNYLASKKTNLIPDKIRT